MKNKLLLLLLLLSAWGARAQTVTLAQESFETDGGNGVRYTSNAFDLRTSAASVSGAFPYFTRALTNPLVNPFNPAYVSFGSNAYPVTIGNVTGSVFWAAEAVESTSTNPAASDRPPGVVTLNAINASNYSTLKLVVALGDARGPSSPIITQGGTNPQYEANDFIRLQYSTDGGTTYNTLGQFLGNNSTGLGPGYMQFDLNGDGAITSADGAQSATNTLDINLRDFSFDIPGSPAALLVRVQIDQRGASEELAFDNIRVTGVANTVAPPVLANIEGTALSYLEGQSATQITNSLTVTNAAGNLTGATVSISSGRVSTQDVLIFVNQSGIAGSYNMSTGVLTLTGSATAAAYQAALRSVAYQNTNTTNATAGTRTVQFVVANGSVTSGVASRNIDVTSALNAATTLPYQEEFTTDGEGTRYASNTFTNSGSGAAWLRTNVNPYQTTATSQNPTTFSGISNSFYWYGNNTNSVANPSRIGTLQTLPINTAGYVNLNFSLLLGASSGANASWQTVDYFRVSYRQVGTTTWVPLIQFRGNSATVAGQGNMQRDADPNAAAGSAAPTGTTLTPALASVSAALPSAVYGQTLEFQVVQVSDDIRAELAFDNLQLTGTALAAPTVTTAAATTITSTSAVLGGNVTADGGAAVTARGIRYGTSSTLSGATQVANGMGNGTFSATISGLTPGTTYYVAAYATNSVGTSQGSILSFTTAAPTITLAPASPLASATVAAAYSQTITASGGTAPYTFAITAGALPAGLTLTSTGTLSGTPTAGGAFSFTVRATDASTGAYSGTQSYSLTVAPPTIAVAPATLPNGATTTAYSQALTASGGTAPYYFAVTSGALPAGLTLAANGVLSGTPTASGSFTFTIVATDASTGSGPYSGSRSYTLFIAAPALTAVVSSTAGTSGSTTATAPIPFAVSFSQSVGTTFVASDVTVTGGTLTSGSFAGSGAGPYSFTVTPSASGTVAVSVAAGAASDANGTLNTASNLYSLVYQQAATAAPVLTTPANSSTVGSLPTFAGTAPAGSTVTLYLTPNGGTTQSIGTTTAAGGSFSLTPATALASGTYSAYATAQASGATVSANSNTNTFAVDATAPTVVASNRQTPTAATTNATSLTFRVTFSESVTGVDAADFTLTTTAGTVTNSGRTVSAVSGSVYDVTVSGVSGSGTVRLDLNASGTGIADAVGNPISGGYTSGQAYILDQMAPTVTLSTTATSPTSTSPIPFSAAFSETVTGLSASSISVTNGTVASGPTGSGSGPYTFSVTPTGNGTVTVAIAANAAQDAAGNGNTASNSLSVSYAAPVTLTTWTAGAGTQDWFTAGNWSAGVPTASTDALIPTGVRFYPLVTAAGATTRALTINSPGSVTLAILGTLTVNGTLTNGGTITQSAGTLTVNGNVSMSGAISKSAGTISVTGSLTNTGNLNQSGGSFAVGGSLSNNSGGTVSHTGGTLSVSGDLTNNSTFTTTNPTNTGGGTVLLGSTSAGTSSNIFGSQTIRFWNLTVNASGAQLSTSAGASVRSVLTLNGTFATNGNTFTLESASTGTALVVNNGNSVVTGNATVQRYIDPSLNAGPGYRHYSAPVSTSTVADLATTTGFIPVVNPAYNTSPTPTAVQPFPTVYGYDEQRVNLTNSLTAFDRGYVSPAALSDPLTVGRGYTVNIGASQLVDFVGSLNNGTLPLSLTSTRDTNPAGGWQLLGNPYPAPLNYNLVAEADRMGLDAAIYVFSSTSQYGGQYRSFVNGFGNPVLPVGQGFFARVSTGRTSANMTFRNAHRLTAPDGTAFQRQVETRPVVQLTLQGTGSPLTDVLYVYFEQGATDTFDRAFDAEKLPNPSGLNLSSSLSASQRLSTDGRAPLGTAQLVVPLAVGVPAAGTYSLATAQLLNLSQVPVYLRDKQTGALIDLAQQPSYQFAVSNAATLLTGRFELVFSPQQPLATVPAALAQQVLVYPNPAKGQVTIELPLTLGSQPVTATLVDAVGRPVREQVLPAGRASHTLLLSELATGVYALRLRTELGTVVRKLVVE